jgi:hypothetical protein
MAILRGSLASGLASIYVYLGHDNIWKTNTNKNKCHVKTFWGHFCYDFITFVISTTLTSSGAVAMNNINHNLLIITLVAMHWLGLTLKATFYIYMHPWVKLNDIKTQTRPDPDPEMQVRQTRPDPDPDMQARQSKCCCIDKTRLDIYKILHYFMIGVFPLCGLGYLSYVSIDGYKESGEITSVAIFTLVLILFIVLSLVIVSFKKEYVKLILNILFIIGFTFHFSVPSILVRSRTQL